MARSRLLALLGASLLAAGVSPAVANAQLPVLPGLPGALGGVVGALDPITTPVVDLVANTPVVGDVVNQVLSGSGTATTGIANGGNGTGGANGTGTGKTTSGSNSSGSPSSGGASGAAADPSSSATSETTTATAPSLGQSVQLRAERGDVTVKVPGAGTFAAVDSLRSIPVGSVIDATDGTVRLRAALDHHGHVQTGTFSGGRFAVRQARGAAGTTDLVLRGGDFSRCPAAAGAGLATASRAPAKPVSRRVRRLWGKDSGGHFRTHGRDSVATVRGTRWLTEDTCAGTRVKVLRGAVSVRDRHTGRAVLVRAGHSRFTPHEH